MSKESGIVSHLEPYFSIYDTYCRSIHGPLLFSRGRFGLFMPENQSVNEWTEALNLHGNNLTHLWETLLDTDRFIILQQTNSEKKQFSIKEAYFLRLYAVIHDMAEVIVSDTPDTQKQNKAYAQSLEMEILDHIVDTLYKDDQSLVSDMHSAINAIGRGGDEFLKRAFRTIECIGYAKVAVNAWKYTHKPIDPALKKGLNELVASVASTGYREVKNQRSVFEDARLFVDKYDGLFLKYPVRDFR